MRCVICRRPLRESAVPGLEIGPKCAADRGLLPDQPAPRHRIVMPLRRRVPTGQTDWINELTPGQAGEGTRT